MPPDGIYDVIRDFQALIAGVLAIAAAYVAYRGAIRQAAATAEAALENRNEARRAAAAGFVAELSHCEIALTANIRRLNEWRPISEQLPVRRIDTGIFNSNQAAVGLLPADEAYYIALAYKLVKDLDNQYGRLLVGEQFAIGVMRDELLDRSTNVRTVVRTAVGGIRGTAGLDQDKAAAIAAVSRDIAT